MNVGLGNLATLKRHLLPASMLSQTSFDPLITDLGLGVAARFEQYCNRKFIRAVNATEVFPADRSHFLFSRFPIESISLSEVKLTEADGWVVQASGFIRSIDQIAGVVYTPGQVDVGPYYAQVRFTFTGGYFFETLEPTDGGYPTAQPNGSTILPDDLRLAWLLQCRQAWDLIDKLGTSIATEPKKNNALADLQLTPEVKRTLDNYGRMELI